ncbi:AMP-binding protein [Saccharopolyspora sp. NFXS83]|uniref:AMP-binding protein n=1 Tax=Saccharopolyspora sp. NFXS83 TaxID=2993560 RepID=UPI00224B7139|nr:AMP-binding protein [Saccharopolyspora sp. NFXS83]MCX2729815.1 AMP-binding protein [Saccharopolyspora sp. NFXS83]
MAAMSWHFSPETGSRFWLDRASSLGFDPLRDVRTHGDLARFPNLVNELRDAPIRDLVPRGYGDRPDVLGAFDSGGTTGAPKRVVLMQDWLERSLAWKSARMDDLGFPRDANWLTVAPSGPHIFGRLMAELPRMRGGVAFTVDLDPRWVRKCIAEGRGAEADRYAEHVVDQVESVLDGQEVGVLVVTPPLLERMSERGRLAKLINEKVHTIMWGGAHMDADTRYLMRQEVFPDVALRGQYGSTMILGGSMERVSSTDDRSCVFDSFSPYTTFAVVDPDTHEEVREGERGQVVMHHVSRSMLLPNNLERDVATRVAAPPGALGVSVADVAPVATFENTSVIEGVY